MDTNGFWDSAMLSARRAHRKAKVRRRFGGLRPLIKVASIEYPAGPCHFWILRPQVRAA